MNFVDIYENACNVCGVRPNSLLHKTLREAPVRPITHLRLADNYVGPKGFLALVPLIEKCQTLESLDLRGNGLDNGSVIALCRVLRSHLGIHTIDLSRNPISAEGGRHLLELLETNTRIIHLVVEQTDLFDAFAERLYQAAAANQGDTDTRPIIVPSRFTANTKSDNTNTSSTANVDGGAGRNEIFLDNDGKNSSNSSSQYLPFTSSSTNKNIHNTTESVTRRRSSTSPGSQHRRSYGSSESFGNSARFPVGGRSDSTAGFAAAAAGGGGGGGGSTSSGGQRHSTSSTQLQLQQPQPNITGALKPKPPTPAIASEAYSRLTKEQRDLMKERYKQKAAVFTQVEQTASHKLAADFRAEIALLEGAQAKADYSRQGLFHSPSLSSPKNRQALLLDQQQQQQKAEQQSERQEENEGNDVSVSNAKVGDEASSTQRLGKKMDSLFDDTNYADANKRGAPSPESKFFSSGVEESLRKSPAPGSDKSAAPQNQQKPSATSSTPSATAAGAAATAGASSSKQQSNPVLVSVPMVPISAPELTSNAALTPADQFRALFNQGCAYYAEKNFDGAYCSWNEAVHIATQERNREWLTIVQSNLQNLSFEMLTTEAQDAINRGDLDDASKSLELALKLATKARNAGWESEVVKLRRNVLHGSFQVNHDKATNLLEQLIKLEPIDVTDDHRFVSPSGKLEAHTAAFVNEWTALLIVKELMERCVQGYRCAKGIGGNNGAALEQLVQGTVTAVSRHLIKIYWCASLHDPMSLAWLGAGRFTRDERESLIKLWADLRGTVKELGHSLWSVVELSQYGNLLLASHELSDALDCFEKAAENAGEVSNRYLTGTSLLFCGVVNLQRSSYAKAEALFRSALSELGEVRFGVAPLRPSKASTAAAAGSENDQPRFVTRDAGNSNSSNNSNNNNAASPSSGSKYPTAALSSKTPVRGTTNKEQQQQQLQPSSTSSSSPHSQNQHQPSASSPPPPLEDLCFFHSQAFFMLSRTLIGSYRYRDALEVHERFLLYQHHDVLFEKLQSNFSAMPTTDHLRATSASLNHPLVYYAVHYRYDWNLDQQFYDVSEHIYSWVVVSEGDGKFNSVDISAEFGVASLLHTIKEARRTLFVDTNPDSTLTVGGTSRGIGGGEGGGGLAGAMVTNLDGVAWKAPLRKLYSALMHQVIDVLSSYAAYSDLGVFTVIPHGFLWLVPFPALLDERDQFLLERITLCHAMCATQILLSQLSVRHLLSSHNVKNMVVRPPPQLVDPANADPDLHAARGNTKLKNKKKSKVNNSKAKKNKPDLFEAEHDDGDGDDDDDDDYDDTNQLGQKEEEEAKNNKIASIDQVLRAGITEEQMDDEATSLVRALGSGTLEMSGTSTDVLAHIAFTNISVVCSLVVHDVVPHDKAKAAMKGGILVASTFDTIGVLSCEEIAFANLPIETVVLPYTALEIATVTRDATAEAILSMARGFLGAGTVSVVFSTWQCSDVYPADFLTHFARDLQRQPNRAVALARAVRALIHEETRSAMSIGSRNDEARPLSCFKPRRWAGIILLGVSEIPPIRGTGIGGGGGGGGGYQQQSPTTATSGGVFNEYNAFV